MPDRAPAPLRYDDVNVVDLGIRKRFGFGRGGFTLSADVFNVANNQTLVQQDGNLAGDSFNRNIEAVGPRMLRLGARLTF